MLNIAIIDFIIPIKYDVVLDNLPIFGILITIAWLGSSLLDFSIGDLTDKLGIKKTLILGVIIGFVGTMIFGLSGNVYWMTFGIFIWGLSYVMFAIPSETYVLSGFPSNYRGSAFGILNFILDIAYATSPLIGFGIIYFFGINHAIFVAAAITLVTIILLSNMRSKSKESLVNSIEDVIVKDGVVKKEFKDIGKMNAREFSILFNMFIAGLWFMATYIAAPLLFFHASEDLFRGALLTFAFMIPFALMELGFGNLADSAKNRMRMIKYGFIISSILLTVFFFIDNFWLLMITAFFVAFFANMGWVASEVHVSKYLPKGKKGEFTSIFVAGRDIGYDISPIFYGFTAILGLKVPFLFLAGFLFLAWLFFTITHRNYKE
jgi:MFS family permease